MVRAVSHRQTAGTGSRQRRQRRDPGHLCVNDTKRAIRVGKGGGHPEQLGRVMLTVQAQQARRFLSGKADDREPVFICADAPGKSPDRIMPETALRQCSGAGVDIVAANWPDGKPIFFRLSCVDWRADIEAPFDGWTLEDSCILTRELHRRGVDLIDCSSGGIRGATSMGSTDTGRRLLKRGFQAPYAATIRRETGVPTMAVGVILDGAQAEAILQQEQADLVAIGREALFDPHWALHAARDLGADPDWSLWPSSYGWWLAARDRIGIAPSGT